MEYQIRREGEEAWILIPVRLLPEELEKQAHELETEVGFQEWKEAGATLKEGRPWPDVPPVEAWKTREEQTQTEGDAADEIGSSGSQRPGAEKLRREILSFCIKPRSRKEIAQQFGFTTQDYVIQKYVLPLVRSRMLQMTIPDRPRSKNQKYFSIQIPHDET